MRNVFERGTTFPWENHVMTMMVTWTKTWIMLHNVSFIFNLIPSFSIARRVNEIIFRRTMRAGDGTRGIAPPGNKRGRLVLDTNQCLFEVEEAGWWESVPCWAQCRISTITTFSAMQECLLGKLCLTIITVYSKYRLSIVWMFCYLHRYTLIYAKNYCYTWAISMEFRATHDSSCKSSDHNSLRRCYCITVNLHIINHVNSQKWCKIYDKQIRARTI